MNLYITHHCEILKQWTIIYFLQLQLSFITWHPSISTDFSTFYFLLDLHSKRSVVKSVLKCIVYLKDVAYSMKSLGIILRLKIPTHQRPVYMPFQDLRGGETNWRTSSPAAVPTLPTGLEKFAVPFTENKGKMSDTACNLAACTSCSLGCSNC